MPDYSRLTPLVWGLLWAALVAAALSIRPLMPVDETRYVTVAWEMWLDGDYLVPHLNGATYSHKPPLLFWLINAGWGIFGVNEWWPRLVTPLFGLASLSLSALTCRRLWPDSQAYLIVPILLLGSFYWGIYTTLTMFDLMIALWTLVGINGLIDVWQGKFLRGWLLFAIAIGLGVLSKGPVILVYLL
ncbi:MAG: glycosyltransferase family 39 protein, partial [Rhodospirillales bacterium]|nr:glycosyltransferase family 39 protein [Rhodospirillales bacterium]